MRVLLSGSSGLIGSALARSLARAGHVVVPLVRRTPRNESEVGWDPRAGQIEAAKLAGLDAVVHLAGESIADARWTPAKKQRIRESRVDGTRALAAAVAALPKKPAVFAPASAIGYYGNRGAALLTEDAPPGNGFLADVCRDWEDATAPAAEAGVRVVRMRFGLVLAREGGPLVALMNLFRWGLGGRLGSGEQYMSWITLDDLVAAVAFLLGNPQLAGPVNCTAPQPVTNREFTAALASALHRPALLHAPKAALQLLLGEMANELLFFSARVLPQRLLDAGFVFQDVDLAGALDRLLG